MEKQKFQIVCDSTFDLSEEMVEKFKPIKLNIVPLKVHFGEDAYLDRVELAPLDFYRMLVERSEFPKTAQPPVGAFIKMFEKLKERGTPILSIHLSSKLSGTYEAALMAKNEVQDADITVFDTLQASVGTGLFIKKALEGIEAGKDKEEVLKELEVLRENCKVFFSVDTLEYLQKGGRIGKAQALLGSILNIKPLLQLENGEVLPLEKVRGEKKAFNRLVELAGERCKEKGWNIALSHANNKTVADRLAKRFKEIYHIDVSIVTVIGPVIGTHTGPGTIGLFLYK